MSGIEPRVLVVDDSEEVRVLFTRQIRRNHMEVTAVGSGQECLELLKREVFDLIMLDIVMPDQTGIEILQQIRKNHPSEELPVMMVSGYADADFILEALEKGANDYVLKPLDLPVMIQRMKIQLRFQTAMRLLQETEARANETLMAVPDLVLRVGPEGELIEFNRPPEGLLLQLFDPLREGRDTLSLNPHVKGLVREFAALEGHDGKNQVVRLKGSAAPGEAEDLGSARAGEFTCFELRLTSVGKDNTVCVIRDVSAMERRERELLQLAGTDALTKISNRRRFSEVLRSEWRRQLRSGTSLVLIIVDIDAFKELNDHSGHLEGDKCLIAVASALESLCLRPGDFVCRYGGEEFAILLPDTDESGGNIVAERMRKGIENLAIPHPGREEGGVVTISLGVAAMVPADALSSEELVRRADAALYAAKATGKNRVSLFSSMKHL